jgi:uncharacterized phage-associated protein
MNYTMRIVFRFNPDKAVQVIAYMLSAVGSPMDKVKLTKLLYLADRQSFIERGVSITGDRLVAVPFGPVPSACLDLLNGVAFINQNRVFRFIHVEDNQVILRQTPGQSLIGEADRAVLDEIAGVYGNMRTWKLVHQTHSLPEYEAAYIEGTSSPIPFELIARASRDERRYRMERAVVSPEATAAMPCPFNPGSDATL